MILGYPAELCLVELVVRALLCHQFVVGSLLENLSVVNHENPVRIFNSRKTVRNDERGTALQQAFDSLLHLNFRLSRIVPEKRKLSCVITPIWARRLLMETSVRLWPSTRTVPEVIL